MAEINSKPDNKFSLLNWLGWFLGLNLAWLLLAVFAGWLGWRAYTLSFTGEVAAGTVVRLEEDNRELTSSFSDIFPVVEFEVNGETYSVRSQNNYRWWNRFTRFPVGKQVEMRYDPADPENAEINSWIDLWGEPIILSVFTIISAIAVNMYLLFRWRIGHKQQAPA